MLIVKLKAQYTHVIDGIPRWTMQPGETPTLERALAKQLVQDGIAEWVGDGCGCPGIDEDTIARHTALATKGVSDPEDPEDDEPDTRTKQDGTPPGKK